MRTMSRGAAWRGFVFGLAVVAGLGWAGRPARASYLSFNLNAQPGSGRISYAGGNGALEGKDLGILTIKGIDTPAQDGEALLVRNGTLNFASGPSLTATQPGTTAAAAPSEWSFAPGGTVTVTGGVPALNIPDGTPLITGTFTDPVFVRSLHSTNLPGTDLKVQGGAFMNIVDNRLAAYFGVPTNVPHYVGGLSTLFSAASGPGGSFASDGYTSGQLTTSPVPEPSTLAIAALVAGAGIAWHRRRRAA